MNELFNHLAGPFGPGQARGSLAVIQWMHPGLGLFAAVVAAPIIIHLLTRHQRRRIVFPTIQFLTEAVASRSRLFLLRHLLLLAMRCLAMAAVVAAFAFPVWHATRADLDRAEHGAAVVVLIDTSASMGYQGGRLSPIAQARNEAAAILNDLRPAMDRANVILVGAEARASSPELYYEKLDRDNLVSLRRDAESAEATAGRANWRAALAQAAAMLANAKAHTRRQIHLISDCQRSNFADVATGAAALPPGVELVIHPVAMEGASPEGPRPNLAVSDLRLDPSIPVVGQPCQLSCRVSNFSPTPADVPVQARLDEEFRFSQRVQVGSYRTAEVSWPIRFNSAGWHLAEARIPADLLPIDDAAWLAVNAVSQLPILLVADEDAESVGTSAYFLNRAMAPRGQGQDRIAVSTVTSGELTEARLAGVAGVMISNVGTLPQRAVEALYYYIAQGGGVAYFLGPGPVADNLALLAAKSAGEPPFVPGPLVDLGGSQGGAIQISYANEQSELLAPFRQEYLASLRAPRVMRYYSVARTSPALRESDILLRYEDNTIAMARGELGAGRLFLCNFSPDPTFCDIGKRDAMVMLIQQLAHGLCIVQPANRTGPGALVGDSVTVAIDQPRQSQRADLSFTDPAGQRHGGTLLGYPIPIHRDWGPLAGAAQHSTVKLDAAALPGIYRISENGPGGRDPGESGRLLGAAAVNVDPRESDLQQDSPDRIAARLAGGERNAKGGGWLVSGAGRDPLPPRAGRPLWHLLLLAAVGLLAGEMVLTVVWKQ